MFRRTFQTIDSETDGRSRWLLFLAGGLIVAWLCWFTRAPVALFETSSSARVEVLSASYPVGSPVAGRVVAMHDLQLGRQVAKGDLLLELESAAPRLELAQAMAQLAAIQPQLEAAGRELEAEKRALEADKHGGISRLQEVRSRHREAVVLARLARREARRARAMFKEGVVSGAELARAKAEHRRRAAIASALAAQKRGATSRTSSETSERRVRIAALEREAATLRGELAARQARIKVLEHQVAQRQVRAPAAGTIGSLADVRVGAVVKEGDWIVTILAGGDLRLVAEFPPAAVFGRVRAGQTARVQFDGFPWIEYGRPVATVTRVAGDVRDGRARVELELDRNTATRIPLQHGLPAEVTIEVDRKTPWRLLNDVVGNSLSSSHAASR
jgi:multidrug resistance efflux pump